MNVGLFQAAAALDANSRWQEMVADNLASAPLAGYKRKELTLEAVKAGLMTNSGRGSNAFVIPKAGTAINFSMGEMKSTGVATDLAIDGKGFFAIQLPNNQTGYTRDGEFHVSATGALVTKEGYPVLGPAGPVQLDKNNHNPITISANGDISQGAEVKAKVKVTDFDNPQLLTQVSGSIFMALDSSIREQASTASLKEGYIEGSNVSSVGQMVSLLSAMRGFEANQKLIQMEDERMGHAISELGNPGNS